MIIEEKREEDENYWEILEEFREFQKPWKNRPNRLT